MGKKLTAIDLFSGAGGLSEGFRQAGFHILAGSDIDPYCAQTFQNTHREAKFIQAPIEEVSGDTLLELTGLRPGELDCLIGGPPCQGFSVYNHKRGIEDERSHLFKEYLRVVESLMPRWVVMENVTGITSASGGFAVTEIEEGLKRLGYAYDYQVLRAEDYGVPQERRRVFFVANRIGAPIVWPEATHGAGKKHPLTTIRDALSDLPKLENGQDKGVLNYASEPQSPYQYELRAGSNAVKNHAAPRLAPVNMERMQHIHQGGSWRDIPFDLLPEGMKRAKRSDHTKRYGRMKWDGQSCTILTKCDVHWGAFIHPEQNRSITVREAARVQSFPDWFEFSGPRTEQYVQVGNAVPPLLGKALALSIMTATSSKASEDREVTADTAAA